MKKIIVALAMCFMFGGNAISDDDCPARCEAYGESGRCAIWCEQGKTPVCKDGEGSAGNYTSPASCSCE